MRVFIYAEALHSDLPGADAAFRICVVEMRYFLLRCKDVLTII